MKNVFKLFVAIALVVMAFALVFTACDNGSGPSGDPPKLPTPQLITYLSEDDEGNTYELVITEVTAASASYIARYNAKGGDKYTLTITFADGTKKISTGTVSSVSGNNIVLQHKDGGDPITVVISNGGMTSFSRDIPVDNGEPVRKPERLTPANPDGGEAVYYYDDNGDISSLPSNANGKVFIEIESENFSFEKQIGNITNGKLSFTLPDFSASDAAKGDLITDSFQDSYTNSEDDYTETFTVKSKPTVNPSNAKMFFMVLRIEVSIGRQTLNGILYCSKDVLHGGGSFGGAHSGDPDVINEGTSSDQYMEYVYLDIPAVISGVFEYEYSYEGSNLSETEKNATTYDCTLSKGWNTVYFSGTTTFRHNLTQDIYTSTTNGTASNSSSGINLADMKWWLLDW